MRGLAANPYGLRLVDLRVIFVGTGAKTIHQDGPTVKFIVQDCFYRGVGPELGRFAAIFAIGLAPIDTGGG